MSEGVEVVGSPAKLAEVSDSHPGSWDGLKAALRDCDFSNDHPASVKLVEKNETVALERKAQGNECFARKDFVEAFDLYTQAIEYAPVTKDFDKNRAIFYCNRAACCSELGRHDEAVEDCTRALEFDPKYVKALLRRIKAYESLDKLEECLADMDAALALEPKQPGLRTERNKMEVRVKEKHEKLKEEMMTSLKGIGNTILGKFGMSLDNFKMEQDPNTGSYSVSFKQ